MTSRKRHLLAALAGIAAFLVTIWPVLLIGWAGASGSLGDLSQVASLGIGLVYSLAIALFAAVMVDLAIRRVAATGVRPLGDIWGAFALGLGVYTLALAVVPAVVYVVLLTDEAQSMGERMWLIAGLWTGGHLLAAATGAGAGAALLFTGNGHRHATVSTPTHSR